MEDILLGVHGRSVLHLVMEEFAGATEPVLTLPQSTGEKIAPQLDPVRSQECAIQWTVVSAKLDNANLERRKSNGWNLYVLKKMFMWVKIRGRIRIVKKPTTLVKTSWDT